MDFVIMIMLFMIGAIIGWFLELIYRNLFERKSNNYKIKNPGFLKGPYLPIYGFGVLILQFISGLNISFSLKVILFGFSLTLIELITGLIFEKYFKIKLWDYSDERLNFKGIISLKFSLIWLTLGIAYYFIFYEKFVSVLSKIVSSVDLTFYIGMVYGIFLIDFEESLNLAINIKKYIKDRPKLLEKVQKDTQTRISHLLKLSEKLPKIPKMKIKENIQKIQSKRSSSRKLK